MIPGNINQSMEICKGYVDIADKIMRSISSTKRQRSCFKEIVLGFIARGRQTLRAIINLCENRFGPQALVLSRSLFEQAVTLEYIEQSKDDRARLFREFGYVILNRRLQWDKKYSKKPYFSDEEVKEIEENYERVKSNYLNKIWWAGKGIGEMAKDVDLEDQYEVLYAYMSEQAHPGIKQSFDHVKKGGDKLLVFASTKEEYIPQALSFGYISFAEIMAVAAREFNITWENEKKA